MLDASFIKAISDLTRAEAKPQTYRGPEMPKNEYYNLTASGTYERVAEPIKEAFVMADLSSFAAWCLVQTEPVDVFVTHQKATAFVKNRTKSRVAINFTQSYTFKWFEKLAAQEDGETFTQRELLRELITKLRGVIPDGTVTQFRKLKFTQSSSSEVEVTAKKANIGKSLEQEVTGTVPETITCTVPLLDDPQHLPGNNNYRLEIVVEVVHESNSFALFVKPDQIEQAKLLQTRLLAGRIRELTGLVGAVDADSTAVTMAVARASRARLDDSPNHITVYHGTNFSGE